MTTENTRLSQSSTVGVDGHQHTVATGQGWFSGAPALWYVGPVFEVVETLVVKQALSAVDPEGDVTEAEEDAALSAPPFVADERRTHGATLAAADSRAAGWSATVARIADATDPADALAALVTI